MTQRRMRRTWIVLLALLLAGSLSACLRAPEAADTTPPVQSETPEPENTAKPTNSPEPENTPALEEDLYSGVLYISNEEAASSVRVYHVADDSFNQSEGEEYEVIDLKDLESYHEFEDAYEDFADLFETFPRIIFMTDAPVTDFRYLEIETVFEDDIGMTVLDTLYRLDTLTAEKPFVVNWMSIGDIGMSRGISFVDEGGVRRYFAFNISGYDGDMYLMEFKPE